MPGISALTRIQMGVEASAGGSTDIPTTYWRGTGALKDNTRVAFPRENVALLGGTTRSYVPSQGGEITLEGMATFEQLPYIFNSGIKAVSATTDASSAFIRTWAVQNSDSDPIATTDLNTMVFEFGDNQQAELMRYGFVRTLALTGKFGEGLEVSAVFQGRTVSTTTFTTGLSIPSIEDIVFNKGKLYVDPSSDTIGTTQKSQTLLEMSLNMKTGWTAKETADGRLDFSFIKRAADEITLDITFEHDATSVAEKSNWRTEAERALRLRFEGDALSTTDAGATYDVKTLLIDLYGKWESFDVLSEQDGNNIVRGKFKVGYSTTASAKATFTVVNETQTLP